MPKIKIFFVSLLMATTFIGCDTEKIKTSQSLRKIDTLFLDSVIKNSDTSYTKNYRRPDFVTADYYISKKDSSIAQVMRDSAKQVRQIIISRNNSRTYFAQYYPNGQLIADIKFDENGQYHGPATYFYASGKIKSSGNYEHGIRMGKWQEYEEKKEE